MKNQSGFTVLEMAIVLVVIGILLGIAVPKYADFRDTANLASAKANVASLRAAASMYYAKQSVETGAGSYPADTDALEALLEEALAWPTGYGYTYDASTGAVTLTTP
jgi:prepilin-type N-terminal cleavage/methylation domain-containing protein